MKKYFAVADPHSFYTYMMQALTDKGFDKDNPEHLIILCGDAFDRGEESKRMLEFLKTYSSLGRLIYIRGNHEDLLNDAVKMMLNSVYITSNSHHVHNGTIKTIAELTDTNVYDLFVNSYNYHDLFSTMDGVLGFINKTTVDSFTLGSTMFVHGWCPDLRNDQISKLDRASMWNKARWENGMLEFKKNHIPADVTTMVCGHWHASWGWKEFGYTKDEWKADAKFDTFIHTNESGKTIVALDACTVLSRKVNCVVFDEQGNILER